MPYTLLLVFNLLFVTRGANSFYSKPRVVQDKITRYTRYTRKNPLKCKVKNIQMIGRYDDSCEFYHVTLSHQQPFPYYEGQYCTVIPPADPLTCKRFAPRPYSIANSTTSPTITAQSDSALDLDNNIELCIRKFINPETNAPGLCSNYLINSKLGDTINVAGPFGKLNIRDFLSEPIHTNDPTDDRAKHDQICSSHSISNTHKVNIILVATGTGIAPFRSFYKYLFRSIDSQSLDLFNKLLLIYGVKNEDCLLYRDELEHLQRNFPGKFNLLKAFSRTSDKRYVQDVIVDNRDFIKSFVDKNSKVFVCGAKAIVTPIKHALQKVTDIDVYNQIANNMTIEVY
ncbi:Ferredoxin--NADP reductase chloroplastic [Babesia microti strain RI]|uniref:ferredoxin--NADP(+) reductase n=1 Tax=Babesia microti (strain RI) TaxID=1133968 RepID=I7IT15_BABMR|nr:Ferredoxin--NADP reductase chloroplastic [Babesia microti strain RI]CCF76016.1 Ferredoxin--NADP reductase chloroplastic [Babesia microti strain RI]|eukprot:XP_012650424.1 Ferredoxin--NADP reductase chloroplastic [Babesia microti strain RI]